MVYQDTQSKTVAVSNTEELSVRLEFAAAQPNAWTVKLEGTEPNIGQDGANLPLDKGAALRGKLLQVVAHMIDANPSTNLLLHRVSILHADGRADTLEFKNPAGQPGDSAVYTSMVLFG